MGALNDEENGGLYNSLHDDAKQVTDQAGEAYNSVKDVKNTVNDLRNFVKDHTDKGQDLNDLNNNNKNTNRAAEQLNKDSQQQAKNTGKAAQKGAQQTAQETKQAGETVKQTGETAQQTGEAVKDAGEAVKETAKAAQEAVEATVDAASEAAHTAARVATDAATLGAAEAVNAPLDVARKTTKAGAKTAKKTGEAAAKSAKAAQQAAKKMKEEAQKTKEKDFKKFALKHPILFIIICSLILTLMLSLSMQYYFAKPFMNPTVSEQTDRIAIDITNPIIGMGATPQYYREALKPRLYADDAKSLVPLTPEYPSMVPPSSAIRYIERDGYTDVDYTKYIADLTTVVQMYIDDTYEEAKTDFPEWVEQGEGKKAFCPIEDPIDYGLTWDLFMQQVYIKPNALSVMYSLIMKLPEFKTDKTREMLSELAMHERFHYKLLQRNQVHDDMYLNVIYHYPPDKDSQYVVEYELVKETVEEEITDEETGETKTVEKEVTHIVEHRRYYAIPEFVSPTSSPENMLRLFKMEPNDPYSVFAKFAPDLLVYYFAPSTAYDSNLKHYKYVKKIHEEMLRKRSVAFGSGYNGYGGGYSIGAIHGGTLTTEEVRAYLNSATGVSGNRKWILAAALSLVGAVDYEWGGGHGSLNPGWNDNWGSYRTDGHVIGLDCTGFVRWAAYTASDQDTMAGMYTETVENYIEREISFSELQPGDIGWYRRNGHGHIGIYLGNGSWVHAPGDGQKVSIAESDGPYQFDRFGTIQGSDGNDWNASKYIGSMIGTETIDMSYLTPGPTGIVPTNTSGRCGSEVINTSNETEMDMLRRVLFAEAYTMGRDGMRLVLDEMINIAIDRGETLYESMNNGHTYEVVWNTNSPVYIELPKIINGAAEHYDELMDVIMTECNNPILDDKVMYFRTSQYHDGHTDAYVWTKGGTVYFSY